jgi:hypothetical protein
LKILSFKLDVLMIEKQNTLEWLDFIITIALDFSESEVNTLTTSQFRHISERIQERKQHYIGFLNYQRFARRKISPMIKEHHGNLLILLDQASCAASRVNPLNTLADDALRQIRDCVYELLNFIQGSFGEYLDLDERAPDAYLTEFTRHHSERINQIRSQLKSKSADPSLIAIMVESLQIDANHAGSRQQAPSFRRIFYQREVVFGLEQMLGREATGRIDDALLELLIYLNFNSRPFMDYYIQHLTRRIDGEKPAREKIHQLLRDYKHFNQMHRKPGIQLSPADSDVKKFVSNWFTQEIDYLKEQSQTSLGMVAKSVDAEPEQDTGPFKVMVFLSVDQIGLFLRALDSLRILKARSMNTVFERIVPFLSTPRKAEISWDSMRSKSYSFEEKDKQTVIRLLESVIVWIKEY